MRTCQAERFKAKLGAIQDDEAVRLVQPRRRVLHITLKVPGLLSRTDLLDLSNVNWREKTHTDTTIRKVKKPSYRKRVVLGDMVEIIGIIF